MNQPQEYLQDIREIRAIMDRSTRFVALSGMTGIVSGSAAVIVTIFLCWYFGINPLEGQYTNKLLNAQGNIDQTTVNFLMVTFLALFVFAITSTYYLTRKRARAAGESLWQGSAKQLWVNLGLPLAIGGGFCLAMVQQGYLDMLAPASLVFYGITLYGGSKYTLEEVRVMGIIQMVLGVIAAFLPGYGLLIWGLGFGLVHVGYGIFMYTKYEK